MAAYKETPRQKMIAMMYLILTALLALNVSKDVLNAFAIVNESLENTNQQYNAKINQMYTSFENQFMMNKDKVRPYWEKAQKAKTYSQNMRDYLTAIRDTTIMKAEGASSMEQVKREYASKFGKKPEDIDQLPLDRLAGKDQYDATTRYFVGDGTRSQEVGKAQHIRESFLDYRQKMKKLLSPDQRQGLKIGPDFEAEYTDASGQKETWENHNFYHTIMAADVTILNKLISEVQNAEFAVLNRLYSNISKEDFKFTDIEAKVIPKSGYILQGGEYRADVIVAAYDTTQRPDLYIQQGVDSVRNIEEATHLGKTDQLEFTADQVGKQKYAGVLRVKQPSGMYENYYFNDSYDVGRKSATVSANKMNVFYKGVPNPVSISVPGVSTHKLSPEIGVGSLQDKGQGNYEVNIPGEVEQRNTSIKVYANIKGERTFFDEYKFRLRKIPDPYPTIGGTYTSGDRIGADFLDVASVIAKTPDFFEFDYTFTVEGFVLSYTGPDGYPVDMESNSHQFTQEMKDQFDRLQTGSRITIERIKVKAPEGVRELENAISFKIN
ncbi:MAG: hypothetical protein K9J27_02070 [Bacteroidales bacterium]|nr:hypothetical protein [Bacteroidales bacterium]MCF8332725.1 hypothetical protein [Bacteroidales bacterium]